jgi:GNAT superfamily N-acetyltransferase
MSSSETIHILLVHPPVASPSAPPWSLARMAPYLIGKGLSLEQYDANLDFFLNHLLTSKHLRRFVDLVDNRKKQDVFEKASPETASMLADLTKNPKEWSRKITGVKYMLDVFRTNDFYEPENYLEALGALDDLLNLVSLAYYPSHIQRSCFYNPTIKDKFQIREFIKDPNVNPFLPLCRKGLAQRLEHPEPKLLILCVSIADQLPAALTMAGFSKKQRPELHIALMGDIRLLASAEEYGNTLVPETDPEALLALVRKLSGSVPPEYKAAPDFSGLPLKDYLVPALVLPFQMPTDKGLDLKPLSLFWADLKKRQQTFNTKGLLSIDLGLKPTHMMNWYNEKVKTSESFFLGLSCLLDESDDVEAMNNVYQAGVRLILWHNPSGLLKILTRRLWSAAKAGIWNHVIMPDRSETDFDKELLGFIAANPNIVHSWGYSRSSKMSSLNFLGKSGTSVAYTQVSKLPGRPFWHLLNDPLHLLLYLDRYGIKKISRWRIRDKGLAVFTVGNSIVYHFVKPRDLPPGYLDEICLMIEAGGSVDTALVRYNLERAFLIGYAMEHGVIVGNSSLKRPRTEYVEAVNQQAGLDLSNYLERGYTSVRPEYRGMGIGAKLLEGLTERVGDIKLFSIISSDNAAAQKMALKNQTRRVATFYSKKLGKEVGVWMPEWMIED